MKYLGEIKVLHVAAGAGELDELARKVNTTAVGDMTVLVDVDTLEDSDEQVAKDVLKKLPENFGGMVYVTR
jgi:hypothetical protein